MPQLATVVSKKVEYEIQPISQSELYIFHRLEKEIESLSTQRDQLKTELVARLDAKATVQPGDLSAHVQRFPQRHPAWKQAGIRKLGEAWAARVLAATEPVTVVKLVVEG